MIRLEDVTLFVRSAALGSFSNAAREAGLLPGRERGCAPAGAGFG